MGWSIQYPSVLFFLKQISTVFQQTGNEIIIHCPYCSDAYRKNASSHGHMYISTENPVFHCFRCESSGTLGTLLKDLGFEDKSIIKKLGTSLTFKSSKSTNIFSHSENNIDFNLKNIKFKMGDPADFEKFERYIYSRLGNYTDYSYFLMTPQLINSKLCVSFYNKNNKLTTSRIINSVNQKRYIRKGHELYYFQDLDFDKYDNIILTEGPFDCISLFKYGSFPKDHSFYLSMLGKNYGKVIDWLCSEHLLIGSYKINLIFDNDNSYIKYIMNISKRIVNRCNPQIKISGFIPIDKKDACDCPLLKEL